MTEDMKKKYPNLFGASFNSDDVGTAVVDVVADTASGLVGDAGAAVLSLVQQAATNDSLVDLRSDKEKYANLLAR